MDLAGLIELGRYMDEMSDGQKLQLTTLVNISTTEKLKELYAAAVRTGDDDKIKFASVALLMDVVRKVQRAPEEE